MPGNAFVTGALSGVEDRYQARIAWLFAFAPAAVLAARRAEPAVAQAGAPAERAAAALG